VDWLLKISRAFIHVKKVYKNGDASLQNPDEECVNFGFRSYISINCEFFKDQDLWWRIQVTFQ